jgi:hypothetical protein
VLGVHTGGTDGNSVSWAVVPSGLPAPKRAHLGRNDWPTYAPPRFPNAELSFFGDEDALAARRLLKEVFVQVGCGAEYQPREAVYSAPNATCQARVGGFLASFGSQRATALSLGLSFGYRMSSYREAFIAPNGEELESSTRMGHGFRIGPQLELRLSRLGRRGFVLGVGGYGATTFVKVHDAFADVRFSAGIPLEATFVITPLGHRPMLGLRASIVGEFGQNLRYTYSGNPTEDEVVEDTEARWVVLGGIGAYAEF